jgi:hypothetical protein
VGASSGEPISLVPLLLLMLLVPLLMLLHCATPRPTTGWPPRGPTKNIPCHLPSTPAPDPYHRHTVCLNISTAKHPSPNLFLSHISPCPFRLHPSSSTVQQIESLPPRYTFPTVNMREIVSFTSFCPPLRHQLLKPRATRSWLPAKPLPLKPWRGTTKPLGPHHGCQQ